MATACNVAFIEGTDTHQHVHRVAQFSQDVMSIDEKSTISLTENLLLTLQFEGPVGSRLYMKELSETKIPYLQDGDACYVEPRREPYVLYQFGEGPYPFTVGNYVAHCELPNGEKHYFAFEIDPKIYEASHQIMLADIKRFMEGLTYSGMKKTLSTVDATNVAYVLEQANHYITSLLDIEAYPFEQIVRQYTLSPQRQHADFRTVQYAASHPLETRHYVPQKRSTYDTLENEWLKQFVKQNVVYMKALLAHTPDKEKLKQLLHASTQFLQLDWVRALDYPRSSLMPAIFQQHRAYRTIFQLYRQLRKRTAAQPVYEMVRSYKESAALYEIWSYLYVIEHFKSRQFTLAENHLSFKAYKGGFVFDDKKDNYVLLSRGDEHVRIFFEHKLPSLIEETTALAPIATIDTKNLPDCRIDFWQGASYKGSHIFDAKYRKMENVYRNEVAKSQKRSTIPQLLAYALFTQAHTASYSATPSRYVDRIPVEEVWAVYPFPYATSTDQLRQHVLRLIDLTPGQANMLFHQALERVTAEKFTS